jgi:hypothetical protein
MRSFKVRDCSQSFPFVDINVRRVRVPDIVAFFARAYFDGKALTEERSPANLDLQAAHARSTAPPAGPDPGRITFVWDFGDGTTATTSEGYVEHDYVERDQSSRQSSFLVRVEARSEHRGMATGIQTIAFINVHYLNSERGVVAPLVLAGPVTRRGGDFVMPTTIRNPETQAIPIERLTAGLVPCAGMAPASDSRQTEASYREVAASAVLSTDVIPPGEIQLEVRFPASLVSNDICQVYLWGVGPASASRHLDLQISMMVMAPKMVPLDMNDPEQARHFEKIRRAASLLGRTGGRVTGEDILRLEQQGKL